MQKLMYGESVLLFQVAIYLFTLASLYCPAASGLNMHEVSEMSFRRGL